MSPHIAPLLLLLCLPTLIHAHGLLAIPNQRGTLDRDKFNQNAPEIDSDAETDYKPHFPAGDKCTTPGCGKRSQERAAGFNYTPFKPMDPSYKWHAGVCGDPFGDPEHMKGGRYYNGGKIVATYKQGGKIAMTMNVIAHHNGFIEFHICDVKKCGGEISEKCFRDGHCKQLERSRHPECDAGQSKNCAPKDPNYPGRWYLPCSKHGLSDGLETFGDGGTILYDLPPNLVCEHCVLQWFWTSANGCNPPGVRAFFDGPNAPKNWGNCPGQAGAVGGVTRVQKDCGERDSDGEVKFPEEYLQCADVRIESSFGRSGDRPTPDDTPEDPAPEPVQDMPTVTPSPSYSPEPEPVRTPEPVSATDVAPTETPGYSMDSSPDMPSEPSPEVSSEPSPEVSSQPSPGADYGTDGRAGEMTRSGVISDLQLFADGERVRSINDGDEIDVSAYDEFTIEAVTSREVDKVEFYINGDFVKKERERPYMLTGNRPDKVHYWNNPILNREFTLVVKADGDEDEVRIKLIDE